MFAWITANLSTIIISLLLIAICIAIILKIRREKKKGKSSCGCGCSGCAMSGMCHPKAKDKREDAF